MAARLTMSAALTKLEREVITDSMLKIDSIQASLTQIDGSKFLDSVEIHNCLRMARRNFRNALKSGATKENGPPKG